MRFVEVAPPAGDSGRGPGRVTVSRIGLGTWQFGSREWGYGPGYAASEAGAIVRRALDLGVNLIDTAEVYGLGRSERIVGAAIAGRRHEAFLATKVLPLLPVAPVVVQRARASARRLGTDRIDLYQLHWPNPLVPAGAALSGMRRLVTSGLVAEVGVSNYRMDGWVAAERALGRRVLSNQVPYNLLQRGPERDLLPYVAATGRLLIAYSPLAQGLLGGRYGPGDRPGGVRRMNPLFLPDNLARVAPLLDTLADVAAAHDAAPAQVALAWLCRRPNVVAIPGASSVGQLESNVSAAELDLADDEDAALTAASDAFTPVSGRSAVAGMARSVVARFGAGGPPST